MATNSKFTEWTHRSESGRRRHKKRRKRRRRRSRSSSSTDSSSSSSRSSSSSYEERSRRKKKRKRRRSSRSSKSEDKDRKRKRAAEDNPPFPSVEAVMAEVNRKPEILSAAAGAVPIKLEAAGKHSSSCGPPKHSDKSEPSTRIKVEPPDVKVKEEPLEKDTELPENDEDLPESVKSFLDVMNELDEANKIRAKKSVKKECQKPKEKKKEAISSKSEVKKEDHKKDRRKSTESKSHGKSHHRSHHESKSSSHSTKKHSDTSKHKSSSKKSSRGSKVASEVAPKEVHASVEKPKPKAIDPVEKEKTAVSGGGGGGSPLPDFSAELDMLPDDLDDYGPEDGAAAVEENDDGGGGSDGFFSEDDEDDELRRIFDAYEPTPKADADEAAQRKAQKLEAAAKARDADTDAGAEIPTAQSKRRVARDGAEERKTSAKHRPPPPRAKKLSPSQILMQRYRSIQTKREDDDLEAKLSEITEGAPATSTKKRVAHSSVRYEPDRAKSKLQRQLDARREATESQPGKQTVAHNVKGMPRLAHAPTAKTMQRLEKPLIATDLSAKVPSNVRQRYLDSIVEECLKIYRIDRAKAYERAKKEEESCNARSKSRNIYLNVVVNCIKKLRAEATEAMKRPTPSTSSSSSSPSSASSPTKPRPNMLTTHMQVLAGKAGTVGTWSIEKPKKDEFEITPDLTYTILKRYLLTKEQLDENCYPIPDPSEKGKAVVREDPWRPRRQQPAEPDKRACDRCLAVYRVDKTGHQLKKEECVYHWGRLYKRKGNRGDDYFKRNSPQMSDPEGIHIFSSHRSDPVVHLLPGRRELGGVPGARVPRDRHPRLQRHARVRLDDAALRGRPRRRLRRLRPRLRDVQHRHGQRADARHRRQPRGKDGLRDARHARERDH